jgi:hypothetical protein
MSELSVSQSALSAREAMHEALLEVYKEHTKQFLSLEEYIVKLIEPLEETIKNHERTIAVKDKIINDQTQQKKEIKRQHEHIGQQAKVVTD